MTTRSHINFLFYIKRTKLLNNGEAPIFVKIIAGKQNAELSILKSINPKLWSPIKKGAIGNTKEAKEVNDHIDFIRQQLWGFLALMRDEGQEISANGLKNAFLGIKSDEKMIAQLFAEHNQTIKLLVGKEYAAATIQRYETCLLHLKSYVKSKYKHDDLPLNMVNPDFIRGYEFFLKTVRNCGHNTTVKYIKNFKKIVKIAWSNGWIRVDPFANVKFTLKKVDRGFLTEEELDKIVKQQFSIERLAHVRDVFLFGCFTGLAYSDLKLLRSENLVMGNDGKCWIHTKRKKTESSCHIPVLPSAQNILDKYKIHPHCIKNNVLLPVYSNQKLNAYLKEIGALCGINKDISSHMARHTFATTVTLNNDVPIESVSKMLGHSSLEMTKIYARLLDKKIGADMSKLYAKY